MPQQPRKARQLWPYVLPDRARGDDVLTDGTKDRKPEQPSIHQSVRPSSTGRARAKRLTPSEARLVDWIEFYVCGAVPKDSRPAAVPDRVGRGEFVGARLFMLKYGPVLILEALNEMTYQLDLTTAPGPRRYWRASIVSPAQYLHWMVKQLAATSEGEERVERRLRTVDERSAS